jgi:protein-S-isoprenylcysteine O-methyltransferase Ste14
MNEELSFRIVFWISLFLIIMFNRIIPALRAKKSGVKILPDNMAKKNEGKITFYTRIVAGVIFMAFLVLYSIYPSFMSVLHLNFPISLRWSGTAPAFIGIGLWIYAQSTLGNYWSPQLQIQKEHKIITIGLYKLIRHPIYAAMFIWVVGLALFTANIIFVFLAIFTIIWLILRVPKEEKMMVEQFGDEYVQYIKKTGKFFPKFKLQKSTSGD